MCQYSLFYDVFPLFCLNPFSPELFSLYEKIWDNSTQITFLFQPLSVVLYCLPPVNTSTSSSFLISQNSLSTISAAFFDCFEAVGKQLWRLQRSLILAVEELISTICSHNFSPSHHLALPERSQPVAVLES